MVYKQKDLVKMVAKESGYYQGAVKDIYDATFAVITQLLADSAPDNLATIKLFEDLILMPSFLKARKLSSQELVRERLVMITFIRWLSLHRHTN